MSTFTAETHVVRTDDGVALHALTLGPTDGPAIVVLHGGPGAHHDYLLPGMAALADPYRLVFYDQRGGGRSLTEPGVDLGWERQVRDLDAVIAHFGLRNPDLLGYSFGGLLVQLRAMQSTAGFGRVVLVSSAPSWPAYKAPLDEALRAARERPDVKLMAQALEASGLRETAITDYRRYRFALSVAGYFVDARHAFAMQPFRVQSRAADALVASLGNPYDFRAQLPVLGPDRALVVHGEQDPIPLEFLRETAKHLDARFQAMPGVAHVPYVEHPMDFFAMVRAFLGETH